MSSELSKPTILFPVTLSGVKMLKFSVCDCLLLSGVRFSPNLNFFLKLLGMEPSLPTLSITEFSFQAASFTSFLLSGVLSRLGTPPCSSVDWGVGASDESVDCPADVGVVFFNAFFLFTECTYSLYS